MVFYNFQMMYSFGWIHKYLGWEKQVLPHFLDKETEAQRAKHCL